jgi:hypothetical protein
MKTKIKFSIFLAVALIASLWIISSYFPEFFEWISSFFIERVSKEDSNGRVAIFIALLGAVVQTYWSLCLGYGLNYTAHLNMSNNAHNGIQELLVCWGVIGMLVCLKWVWDLLRHTVGHKKRPFSNFIPFIAFFGFIQFLQWFTMNNYLLVMMVAIIAIRIEPKRQPESREIIVSGKENTI